MVTWMSGLVPGLQNQLERFDSASDLPKSSGYPTGIRIFFALENSKLWIICRTKNNRC